MKMLIRVEHGAFDCGGSEHDITSERGYSNDDSNASSETPRIDAPMYGNDKVEDKHKMPSNRIIFMRSM